MTRFVNLWGMLIGNSNIIVVNDLFKIHRAVLQLYYMTYLYYIIIVLCFNKARVNHLSLERIFSSNYYSDQYSVQLVYTKLMIQTTKFINKEV